MHGDCLKPSIMEQGKGAGTSSCKFGGANNEAAREVGQAKYAINFAGQFDQSLGAATVQFRLMQIVSDFQDDRHLIRQCARAADVLLGNAGAVQTVEHAKHTQHFAAGSQEGDGQKLLDVISGDNVEVGAFLFAGVVGPENLFRSQSACGDPFRESYFQPARCAPFGTVTDAKRIVFQQGNKAAAETK